MGAKDIIVKPIHRREAEAVVKRLHYSGKVTKGSQLHLGVFYAGSLEGALQFGPSMDKRRTVNLVRGTRYNGFVELNRMAFSEKLPRNSESRALGVALRMLRKHRPDVEWVISFADATQCGDGAIYRASGFVLTSIKKNSTMLLMPNGAVVADKSLNDFTVNGRRGAAVARERGAEKLPGFQLRYVYFLNRAARARLTVPEIPFSRIAEIGAGMYKGKKIVRAGSIVRDVPDNQSGEGGASPTPALQINQDD